MNTVRTILISTVAALGLAACGSSQPSNQEPQDAITKLFTQASSGAMTVTGFRDFKLTGCHKPTLAMGSSATSEAPLL